MTHDRIASALEAWSRLLGPEAVLAGPAAEARYGADTLGVKRAIPAALRPKTTEQVVGLVRVASDLRVPLYPISTGANWGYGSALPVVEGCVVVDLSRMDRIDATDIELGVVTVEPGVTQRTLRAFLDEGGLPFLVPVHGGGPDCSLVGNALERGYGITPYADHFGAVTALEAVLANGEVYRTPLSELGAATVDRVFKWGVGPYLDGLFSQGNFGIVTRMTLALAPTPERIETFFFGLPRDGDLEAGVAAVRRALVAAGNVTGSINLMNARRVLSMMEPYPSDQVRAGGIVPQAHIDRLARRARVMPWTGIGALYGARRVVAGARSTIRSALRPTARRLLFLTPSRVHRGVEVLRRLPARGGRRLWSYVSVLDRSLQLVAGAPSEIALPLAYWKSGTRPDPDGGSPMNPARDGCGLIWYSPLVPMVPGTVRTYVDRVEGVCTAHGIEPLITLTSLSSRCFDSTVPLLFDPSDASEVQRAHACFRELFEAGRRLGCLPYRSGIHSMPLFTGQDTPFWRTVRGLKSVLDPHGILAPGRYSPAP
jgi:4-cresol dehydrogenase (hydroxylating)